MYDNPNFVKPFVPVGNILPKSEKKLVNFLFEEGKRFLNSKYAIVEEELNHMDLFGFNMLSDSCEIEIKVADYDLYKEATKPVKKMKHKIYATHRETQDGFCPNYFYYLVPENLVVKAVKFVNKHYPDYGVLAYNPLLIKELRIVKESNRLTNHPFTGELLKIPYKDYFHKR